VTPASDHQISRENRLVITALVTATFVVILNETIMNVALPRLMAELRIDAPTVQWLATAFMLTMSVVIPTTGFLLQRLARKTVFVLAMGLFSSGTLLAALAPGFGMLLLARIVQASGTAIMLPLLMTSVLTLIPVARRGQVMGTVSIVISVAPAIGPTISGLILQFLSWRFMFLTVLPIALAALFFGARKLGGSPETQRPHLDALSVILTVPAFGGVVYGLSQLGGEGSGLGPALPLAVGLVCLALFTARQLMLQRSGAPLLDLRAFTHPMYTVATALLVVGMIALFGVIILLPIYLQQVRGLDTLSTGLLLLPGGLVMGLLAPTVGKWFDRVGPVPLTLTGTTLMTAVLFALAFLASDTPIWLVLVLHIALSLGLALLFTPAFTSGLNPLPPHLYSHGSAILSTLQQVAGAAGTALLVGIMASQARGAATSGAIEAQMAGFRAAFLVAACVAIASIVLAGFLRNRPAVAAEGAEQPAAAH
jgi:DHA2 family lincomycin resistance protein-like MFS transporter